MDYLSDLKIGKLCLNCRFWQELSYDPERYDGGTGLCRRRAPSIVKAMVPQYALQLEDKDEAENFDGVFPQTIGFDWCGDYRPDKEKIADAKKAVIEEIIEQAKNSEVQKES